MRRARDSRSFANRPPPRDDVAVASSLSLSVPAPNPARAATPQGSAPIEPHRPGPACECSTRDRLLQASSVLRIGSERVCRRLESRHVDPGGGQPATRRHSPANDGVVRGAASGSPRHARSPQPSVLRGVRRRGVFVPSTLATSAPSMRTDVTTASVWSLWWHPAPVAYTLALARAAEAGRGQRTRVGGGATLAATGLVEDSVDAIARVVRRLLRLCRAPHRTWMWRYK